MSTRFSLSMEMSRLTRDGTAEPVSRDQILRHARGQENIHFPCSADHEQDWKPYPVDPYSAVCDDHTYIHTHTHTAVFCLTLCSRRRRSRRWRSRPTCTSSFRGCRGGRSECQFCRGTAEGRRSRSPRRRKSTSRSRWLRKTASSDVTVRTCRRRGEGGGAEVVGRGVQ